MEVTAGATEGISHPQNGLVRGVASQKHNNRLNPIPIS